MVKTNFKGIQGDWIRIEPNKVDSLLSSEELIQRGEVIGAGKKSKAKVGDMVIVRDWLVEKIRLGDEIHYYFPSESILEIL